MFAAGTHIGNPCLGKAGCGIGQSRKRRAQALAGAVDHIIDASKFGGWRSRFHESLQLLLDCPTQFGQIRIEAGKDLRLPQKTRKRLYIGLVALDNCQRGPDLERAVRMYPALGAVHNRVHCRKHEFHLGEAHFLERSCTALSDDRLFECFA